jgi:glutamate-ammonia-ligase adenylyltransferase
MVGERRFALGVQLITAHRDPIAVAEGYSDLAEAAIVALSGAVAREFARPTAHPGGELVVLALGRLGGRALTHASDLDLIYLFDAPRRAVSDGAKPLPATDYYNRLASRITAALSVPTAAGPLYDVDTGFGRKARRACSRSASPRSTPISARGVDVGAYGAVPGAPADRIARARAKVREPDRSILRRRAIRPRSAPTRRRCASDMARHKPPAGPLDIKLGAGGLVDLEFAVHTLQLTITSGSTRGSRSRSPRWSRRG